MSRLEEYNIGFESDLQGLAFFQLLVWSVTLNAVCIICIEVQFTENDFMTLALREKKNNISWQTLQNRFDNCLTRVKIEGLPNADELSILIVQYISLVNIENTIPLASHNFSRAVVKLWLNCESVVRISRYSLLSFLFYTDVLWSRFMFDRHFRILSSFLSYHVLWACIHSTHHRKSKKENHVRMS